ncbi:uncharacterized protein FTOL_09715 [Fusarium torulosum]|uniref:Uncharacterized protein n=1 Tax=Fusarium torulosum TaxID=33205 RepID=A0AAE8SL68_9HYPO|nr:uncharacterized protein FTOL_09715 [Fusarium torulosum]
MSQSPMKDQLQVKPQQNLDSYRSLCSPSSKSTTGGKSQPDAYYHSRLSLCSSGEEEDDQEEDDQEEDDQEEDDQEEDDDEDDDETDETLYQKFKAQAMCLLNVEVLLNGSQDDPFSVPENPISQYLEDQVLNGFCAPRSQPDLTLNKKCRFVDVKFRPAGIKTKGHLWRLGRIINTARFRLPLPEAKRSSSSLSRDDERRLTQLAAELRHLDETSLAAQITRFLNHDPDRQREGGMSEPFPMHYMCLMAQELATAIVEGKLLRLGRIWNTRGEEVLSSAIFVWDLDDTEDINREGKSHTFESNSRQSRKPKNAYAFTASRPLECGSQQRGTNDLYYHLSLEVECIPSREKAGCPVPRLYIKFWAVGLYFFYSSATSTVTFP